jgi:hypothetical protein
MITEISGLFQKSLRRSTKHLITALEKRSGVTYSIVNILGRWDRDVILKKLVPISPAKPSASSKIKRGGNMGNIVIEVRDELGTTH